MKKLLSLLLGGLALAQVADANAVGFGNYYSGNSDGKKAYEKVGDSQLRDTLLSLKVTSYGEGGTQIDLSKLNSLPEYLVIKGGPGYVVLNCDELLKIWNKDKIVRVEDTTLLNGGGKVPTISHWAGLGCKNVPEPSTAVASLGALVFGGVMLRRLRRR
jgi:hypothetical protein